MNARKPELTVIADGVRLEGDQRRYAWMSVDQLRKVALRRGFPSAHSATRAELLASIVGTDTERTT